MKSNTKPQPPDPLLKLDPAAAYLGVSPETLRYYRRKGYLPVFKAGNRPKAHMRFRKSDLDAFLANGGAE